jgi:GT2 family glycosyltransferase
MQPEPRVSIVCPAYYSHGTIEESLRALLDQTYQDFEIVVVNSSPETVTQEIVTQRFPSVRFVQSPVRLYPHAARNLGVTHTRGDLIVFTDPDCIACRDWLEKIVARMDRGSQAVVGGMGVIRPHWLETGIHLQKFYWCLEGARAGTLSDLATANACLARQVWQQAGPFNADIFCGDTHLSWKLQRLPTRIDFEPDAVVLHDHQTTLGRYIHERITRGKEFARVRSDWFAWSKARALAYLLAAPLTLAVVLIRAARSCAAAGYGWSYLATFPLQFIGHASWLLGESRAHLEYLRPPRSLKN